MLDGQALALAWIHTKVVNGLCPWFLPGKRDPISGVTSKRRQRLASNTE